MFSKLATSVVTLASLLSISQATALERRLDYCVDPTIVHIKTYEISYPVFINTYISANTIININGGVTININNAPTYISTVVTGTVNSTVFATSTATATITTTATVSPTPAATGIPLPGPNAIPINLALVPTVLKKRQSGLSNSSYIGSGGQAVQGCAQATTFYLQDGNLLAGNGEIVSTGFNLSYAPFAASTVAGPITQTFSVSAGILQWTNALFPNKVATFCLLGGILEAVFVTEEPVGCSHQLLQAIPRSDCAASASSLPVSTQVSTSRNGTFTAPTLGPTVTTIVSTLSDGSLTTFVSTVFPTGTAGVSSTAGTPIVITSTVTNPDGSVSTILITQTPQPTGAPTTGFSNQTFPGTVTTSTGPPQTSTLGNGSVVTNSGPITTLTLPPVTQTTSTPVTGSQSSTNQTSSTLLPSGTISPDTSFVIAANTGGANKHKRAATKWFTFINDTAALSDTLDGAALFSAALGRLYSGGKNIGLSKADIEAGFAQFRAFLGEPDISEKFDVSPGAGFNFTPTANGTALGFVATFCFTQDGKIITKYSSKGPAFTCTPLTVTIQVVSNNDSQITTSTSSMAPTSIIPPFTTTQITTLPDGQVTATTITGPAAPTSFGNMTTSGSMPTATGVSTPGQITASFPTDGISSPGPGPTITTPSSLLTPSSSPTTSATSTADISGDMSADLNLPEPTATPVPRPLRSLKKRANVPGNKLLRGGLLRSPWAPRLA
ncbi:hypothetical protein BP6252_05162 [Coleophoma cylindrospora]|uniref:DUF7908 domain-containing protein n=1 Tax=Coleophoma cylindrospora TaxID=1849047 RepID=A0A3D8RSU0_9HELO|nr:hypothetical protein BP6252_05162 [Coleophoma cylindrospora]